MKNLLYALMVAFMVTSCGAAEQIYDKQNYESLTNETGDVSFYSGGKLIITYENAKILYSSADTQAMFITTSDGKTKYIQGDIIIDL